MARKTFEIRKLREMVNFRNTIPGDSPEDMAARRAGNTIYEILALEADNYHGFRYVSEGGEPVPTSVVSEGDWPDDYDETRREYYGK